mgnify:CR=1 FL=1
MKKTHYMTLIAAGLSLAISSVSAFEGDAEAGKEAAVMCVACHQPDGGGMNIPGALTLDTCTNSYKILKAVHGKV